MTVSFTSTLYLLPVLELLLDCIPTDWHAEVHLGLQEALVNAAKHGNKLDPGKIISVLFSHCDDRCEWVISDQGDGFLPPDLCQSCIKFLIKFSGTLVVLNSVSVNRFAMARDRRF
jgi:serine/threonine-protein kinase RsbW